MVTLEHVKLLETKVTRTIEYVKKVTEENSSFKEKLGSCQKRIDELNKNFQLVNPLLVGIKFPL